MILYLGASSLVKLYVDEADSGDVRKWVGEAEIVATCRVAYTEIISALDSRFKKGDLPEKDYERLCEAFRNDWGKLAVIDFDDLDAGRLARTYGLRRLDALHLSAARMLHTAGDNISLAFSSASERLCRAADLEGLRVLPLR